jgi:hypothetical protein
MSRVLSLIRDSCSSQLIMTLRSSELELSFPWFVSGAGYEWTGGRGSRARLCQRNIPKSGRWYHPLFEYPALFRVFAELQGPDQIRRFADQYGVLFDEYSESDSVQEPGRYWSIGAARGTSLNAWAQEIADMKCLTEIWDSIRAGSIKNLKNLISWKRGVEYELLTPIRVTSDTLAVAGAAHPFREGEILKPARHVLQREINKRLSDEYSLTKQTAEGFSYFPILLRRSDDTLRVKIRPGNLLSAMWLQFAQVVGGSYELRQCPICHRHFVPKRSDAVTCKDSCRQKKSRKNRDASQ